MTDPFVAAVADLGSALQSGEEVDVAIEEIAAEHSLRPMALRNRATLAFGHLATYRERTGAALQSIAAMTKAGLDYQIETERLAERPRMPGERKFTAQDIRAADSFFGIDPVTKRRK